jgi:hypothetical protein
VEIATRTNAARPSVRQSAIDKTNSAVTVPSPQNGRHQAGLF